MEAVNRVRTLGVLRNAVTEGKKEGGRAHATQGWLQAGRRGALNLPSFEPIVCAESGAEAQTHEMPHVGQGSHRMDRPIRAGEKRGSFYPPLCLPAFFVPFQCYRGKYSTKVGASGPN